MDQTATEVREEQFKKELDERTTRSLIFQQALADVIMKAVHTLCKECGLPPRPDATIAAGIANAMETLGLTFVPLLHEAFADFQADLQADPIIMARRQRVKQDFYARSDLATRLHDQGLPNEEIREKIKAFHLVQVEQLVREEEAAEGARALS